MAISPVGWSKSKVKIAVGYAKRQPAQIRFPKIWTTSSLNEGLLGWCDNKSSNNSTFVKAIFI